MGTWLTSPKLWVKVAEDKRGGRQGDGHRERMGPEVQTRRQVGAGHFQPFPPPQVSRPAQHRFEPKMEPVAASSELKRQDGSPN